MAVLIVLAIRLVVLIVVRDEVVEREAVVRGDEIDAGPRLAAAAGKGIGGRGNARGKFRQLAVITLPVCAYRVAELVVPLCPAGRETADLVAAGTDIPRLSNHLHLRQHRVLL